MPTPSPLASLVAILASVCHQAEQNKALLHKNEAATRAALIDPILRALGWDTANVRMVEPERTVENKQSLDYVLKGPGGVIQSVIEAKRLGESLDKLGHVGALIGYAFSLKPVSFFITDGLHWHCYSPGHSHYEPTSIIELRADMLLPAALQLLQLLDATHSGHGLGTPTNSAPTQLFDSNPILYQNQQTNSPIVPAKNYIPLTIDLAESTKQLGKPQWLRLPDGQEYALKVWKDILVKVAELVLQTQHKLPVPLPDKAGKKTMLLSWAQPQKGLSFKPLIYQDKTIYLYTNYDVRGIITNTLYLFQQISQATASKAAVSF